MLTTAEEAAAWEKLIGIVSFRGGLKFALHVDPDDYGVAIRASTETLDIKTKLPTTIHLVDRVPCGLIFHHPNQALSWLHATTKRLLLHEFDECFCVNGQPLVEPHPKEVKRGDNP